MHALSHVPVRGTLIFLAGLVILPIVCSSVCAEEAARAPRRWLAVAGGADPASTQVSLEQDVALATEILGRDGLVLFAGGPDVYGVQILAADGPGDSLRAQLGEIMDPRDGRETRFRKPGITPDGAATRENVIAALTEALAAPSDPLLVFVATHGLDGETPAENSIHLWGGAELTVAALAEILDTSPTKRPVRFVVSACFSGGFADLVFAGASAAAGAAPTLRCGLFASRWDEESSGCDPNPDRRVQEGYGMHFLHALRGEDRSGVPLPVPSVDYNGDGKITLLEAHTRARIASSSLGSPTTSSERWLRHVAPSAGEVAPVDLPEEDAVIAALGSELSVSGQGAAESRLAKLEAELAAAREVVAEREVEESSRFRALRISLLERWPLLDDPWHSGFEATLRSEAKAIRDFLAAAPEARDYGHARERLDHAWVRTDELRLRTGRLRRLVRAYQTRQLAARLHAAGGEAWRVYQEVLACERTVP